MRFTRYFGIDYAGAQTPESRIKGLQVYESRNGGTPERIGTPPQAQRTGPASKVGSSVSVDEVFSRVFAVHLRNTAEFPHLTPN
jgi:hypothetical protein